jgi:fructan beta-fructosidase
MKLKTLIFIAITLDAFTQSSNAQLTHHEMYRPQIHFSPQKSWMNDPNGMLYYKGTYHLFFQYFPDSTVWGPMHWGHATTTDLVHWQQQPIALYPDSVGYIFSGSAVVDKDNTSGLGKDGKTALVAIFTQHDTTGEKQGKNDFQNQSIAYSLDDGKTWTKYGGNPVLRNPGITDFRDPKVMWYEADKKWIMTLATKDRVTFYSSPDLKNWTKESEFGKELGAHGGVWECPDLITLDDNGKKIWVLIASINPGGPNKGSATQYFLGEFDGKKFSPFDSNTRWLDYGPDDYAGVTWSNTGSRKIFLGWMSNWLYANIVPTSTWRSAMTIPRELKVKHVGNDMYVASEPVIEINNIQSKPITLENIVMDKPFDLLAKTGKTKLPCRINFNFEEPADFSLVLSNDAREKLMVGYDKKQNQYFIDRSNSGKVDFQKDFAAKHIAPRLSDEDNMNVSLIIDMSSIEVFADDGLSVMTEIFFPSKPFDQITIQSSENVLVKKLTYATLSSIWH